MFESFKKNMMTEFKMADFGLMHYFLGIEVVQSDTGIFISQKKYILQDCNFTSTPTEFDIKLRKDDRVNKIMLLCSSKWLEV
ncbi:Retrovirus-related Pol polyprotein from transposon TNT 1-94 [Gossypium australe]|uniref:Retrovirus-related Pol polyprotein from transposon TNT 1-94 n=1 Tax=Gossypium australe TaxID=47621 RepID=A0A5B6WJ95_9ROSI|nr:Retrovirus-related Pol polyprotein from transposon TNT 1-94 [Gossypium australe]